MEEVLLNIKGQLYWLGPLLLGCFSVILIYVVVDMFCGIQDEINKFFF